MMLMGLLWRYDGLVSHSLSFPAIVPIHSFIFTKCFFLIRVAYVRNTGHEAGIHPKLDAILLQGTCIVPEFNKCIFSVWHSE